MKLPMIDLSKLPDLSTLTGMFGTTTQPGHDDTIIVIAAVVYESNPPGSGLF
jgi:hypothetical protein